MQHQLFLSDPLPNPREGQQVVRDMRMASCSQARDCFFSWIRHACATTPGLRARPATHPVEINPSWFGCRLLIQQCTDATLGIAQVDDVLHVQMTYPNSSAALVP
ncbi:MAG: hypothetical protein IPL29_03850 [Propionivibrio sp.]|nr:hypothetical protein [Propionivibrio sp.]